MKALRLSLNTYFNLSSKKIEFIVNQDLISTKFNSMFMQSCYNSYKNNFFFIIQLILVID